MLYKDAKSAFEANYKPGDLHPIMQAYHFTDDVPGEKCNNGGEYGFYTHLYPSTLPGVFEVVTSTTCDFSTCNTGWKGYGYFTDDDVRQMQEESEAVEERGCMYP